MGVTSFQQSLYEFFDSGLLFRIALLQKTIFSFHIVALTAISVSAVTKVSPRPRLNHMRMHEILRWRICFRCLIRKWGVREAICLALGHVWRDSYVPQTDATSREERYWDLVDAIKSKTSHFRIFDWHAVYRVNMTDYAHHADSSNVLHGMQALVAISDGADSLDCAAMAIGQSRHLGGGLLVPVDLYLSSLRPDEDFGKGVPTWLK